MTTVRSLGEEIFGAPEDPISPIESLGAEILGVTFQLQSTSDSYAPVAAEGTRDAPLTLDLDSHVPVLTEASRTASALWTGAGVQGSTLLASTADVFSAIPRVLEIEAPTEVSPDQVERLLGGAASVSLIPGAPERVKEILADRPELVEGISKGLSAALVKQKDLFGKVASTIKGIASDETRQVVGEAVERGGFEGWLTQMTSTVPLLVATQLGRKVGGAAGAGIGALGGPKGAAIAGGLGQLAGGYVPAAAAEYVNFYDQSTSLGIDLKITRKYSRIYGTASGAIEYAQALLIFKPWKGKAVSDPAKRVASAVLKEAGVVLWEGGEEFSQNTLQNWLLQKAAAEHEALTGEKIKAPKLLDNAVGSFLIGVTAGGMLRAPGHVLSWNRSRQGAQAISKTLETITLRKPSTDEVRLVQEKLLEKGSASTVETEADHEELRRFLRAEVSPTTYNEVMKPMLQAAAETWSEVNERPISEWFDGVQDAWTSLANQALEVPSEGIPSVDQTILSAYEASKERLRIARASLVEAGTTQKEMFQTLQAFEDQLQDPELSPLDAQDLRALQTQAVTAMTDASQEALSATQGVQRAEADMVALEDEAAQSRGALTPPPIPSETEVVDKRADLLDATVPITHELPPEEVEAAVIRKDVARSLRELPTNEEFRESLHIRAARRIMSGWDFEEPLRAYPVGRLTVSAASDLLAIQKSLTGQFEEDYFLLERALRRSPSRKWLMDATDDPDDPSARYFSNFRRAVEGPQSEFIPEPSAEIPPEAKVAVEEALRLQEEMATEATEARLFRREGSIIARFRMASGGRLTRLFTQRGVEALESPNSAEGLELRETIKALPGNEDFGDPRLLEKALNTMHEGWTKKGEGSLEYVRKITNVPDYIYVNGKRIAILHTDPMTILRKSLRSQAQKIAWSKTFGQGLGRNPGIGNMASVAKVLGVTPKFNKEVLVTRMVEAQLGSLEGLSALTMAKLRELGKGSVPLSNTREDYLRAIDDVQTLEGLDDRTMKKLRTAANAIGGISSGLEGNALLMELKQRLYEDLDDLGDDLLRQARNEGGPRAQKDLQRYLDLVQGKPYSLPGTNVIRVLVEETAGSLIGATHVSLVAVPNVVQPFHTTGVLTGERRLIRARLNVAANPVAMSRRGASNGAYVLKNLPTIDTENGPTIRSVTRYLRGRTSRLFLAHHMFHKNNVVSAEAFRILAEDWRRDGIRSTKDLLTAQKDLNLTEDQIRLVNEGQMSDLVFKKIIQEGVAKTQFVTEPQFRRGILQNSPMWRWLFPYQDFRGGMLRSIVRTGKMWPEGIRTWRSEGNPKVLFSAFTRTLNQLARVGIAGFLIRQMRKAILGSDRRPEEDERTWAENFLRDILKIYAFGQVGMMLAGTTKNRGLEKGIIGMLPKFRAIVDMGVVAYNEVAKLMDFTTIGRQGNLSFTTQAKTITKRHFPAFKAGATHLHDTLWPDHRAYRESRALYFRFREKILEVDRGVGSERPINPELFRIKEAVARNDDGSLQELLGRFYEAKLADRGPFQSTDEVLKNARASLRSSLQAARPIPLDTSNPNYLRYMSWLSPKDRRMVTSVQAKYIRTMNLITRP